VLSSNLGIARTWPRRGRARDRSVRVELLRKPVTVQQHPHTLRERARAAERTVLPTVTGLRKSSHAKRIGREHVPASARCAAMPRFEESTESNGRRRRPIPRASETGAWTT